MRLLALRLLHWGPWERCELQLHPRFTLLHGPNGAGKSTLVGALSSAFFDSHRSRAQALHDLVPWGTRLGPRVELELELSGERYRLAKQFIADASAAIDRWTGRGWRAIAEGRQAEDKLRELLDLDVSRGKVARRGAAEVLWALQGQLELPKTLDPRVERALREGAGHLLEPPAARRIAERLLKRYQQTFKADGNPRKNTELQRLTARADELYRRRAELHAGLADSEAQQSRLAELTSELELADRRRRARDAELADTRQRLEAASDAQRSLREARLARESAAASERELSRQVEAAQRLEARVAEHEAALAAADRRLAELAADDASRQQRVAEQERELTLLRQRWRQLNHAQRALRAHEQRAQLGHQRERLEQSLARAGELDEWIAARRQELELLHAPTADQLAAIDALRQAVDQRVAPGPDGGPPSSLRFTAHDALELLVTDSSGTRRVRLVPGDTQRFLAGADGLVLELPGQGTIELEGSGRAPAVDPAADELAQLLEPWGDRPLDTLREEAARRDALRHELQLLEAELRGLSTGGAAELREQARQLEAAIARLPDDAPVELPADVPPEATADDLASLLGQASHAGEAASQAHQEQAEALAGLRAERANLQATADATRARLAEARAELEQLTADGSDTASRVVARDQARQQLAVAQQQLASLEASHGDLEALPRRVAQLEADEEAEARTVEGRRAEAERLRGALHAQRRGSLADERARLDAELADVERRLEREQRRADGLRMLHDAYVEARQAGLSGLLTPLANRLREDLTRVGLPLAALRLDDQLRPASVSIELDRGARADDVAPERLSLGERSQLVTVLRLQLAELLAAQRPQLVVLDDQLVHSDPERAQAIVERLAGLPATVQVLLVTCHPDVYDALPASCTRRISTDAAGQHHRPVRSRRP